MTVQIEHAGPPLHARTRWLIGAMALVAFMAVLNGTAVTSSLAALGVALDTTLSGTIWVTTSYLVAASAAVPLIGWLTARLGAARVLQYALVGFAVGSLLSGLAWSLSSMVAFRAVQGLAGGLIEPAAIAVIGTVTPAARMGRVMGLVSLVINLGPVAGPLLGGAFVDAGAWRWIFWMNVPLAVIVGVLSWVLLRVPSPRAKARRRGVAVQDRAAARDAVESAPVERAPVEGASGAGAPAPVDGLGLALLPPGFVLLLLGLNRWGAGADVWIVLAALGIGAVMIAAYVRHALRTPYPLLDLRLLRTGGFAAALGIMSGVGLVMYTQLAVLPLFAEEVLGLGSDWRPVPVAVLGLGLMISMTAAGRLSDTVGARTLVRGGALVTLIAAATVAGVTWYAHTTDGAVNVWVALAVIFVLGLGFGGIASPTFASVYRVLPKSAVGQGTAALFIVVQLFASAGVTLVGFLTAAVSSPIAASYAFIAGLALVIAAVAALLPGRS